MIDYTCYQDIELKKRRKKLNLAINETERSRYCVSSKLGRFDMMNLEI